MLGQRDQLVIGVHENALITQRGTSLPCSAFRHVSMPADQDDGVRIGFDVDQPDPISQERVAMLEKRVAIIVRHRRSIVDAQAAASCSKTVSTSSSCVLGVTLGMTCATMAYGPMMNVARRAPKYLRPYMLFSAHVP